MNTTPFGQPAVFLISCYFFFSYLWQTCTDGAPELPKSRGVKFGGTAMPTELEVIMLRASRTPGPSEYQDMKNSTSLSTRGCGKISDANVPGQIELAIRRTRENPGPGNYVLPSTMLVGGGKFNDANPESYLAKIIRTSGRTPGPNQYQDMMNSSSLSTRGCGKISDANVPGSIEQAVAQHKHCPGPSSYTLPSTMLVGGGKFNDANPESYLETIIRTANESPGPNQCKLGGVVLNVGVFWFWVSDVGVSCWLFFRLLIFVCFFFVSSVSFLSCAHHRPRHEKQQFFEHTWVW